MKQIQPFQKHWLQLTSIVVCRLKCSNWAKFECSRLNKANLKDMIAAACLVISNWIQIVNFSACMTFKFDRWPCKNNRTPLLCNFKLCASFCEFKLELQSENAQFESKSTFFFGCVTLKFDRWPWKMIGLLFYATPRQDHNQVAKFNVMILCCTCQ